MKTIALALALIILGTSCATSPPPPTVVIQVNPQQPKSDSVFSKWWFWTGLGIVAVGAVAIGAAASQGEDNSAEANSSGLRVKRPKVVPVLIW